jgi:hypothetical protein
VAPAGRRRHRRLRAGHHRLRRLGLAERQRHRRPGRPDRHAHPVAGRQRRRVHPDHQPPGPHDTVHRYVTLTNTGTIEGRDLSLTVTSTGDEVLRSGAKALQVSVSTCSVAWNPTTGACGGTLATPLAATSIAAINAAPLSAASLAADSAGKAHVRVSTTLPDTNEHSVNGAPVTGTVQGKAAALTYTFTEQQRAGTTTTS